jgi:copper chaperone CopZ
MIRFGWINSLLGGFLISLSCPCCFIPLFLNLFGIGCAGLNTFLLPYRPIFISLTVISLTYSYFRYRPSKLKFFTMVILTLFLSFSPEILRIYNNQLTINDKFDNNVIITHWQIIGMHCESCCSAATRSLQKINEVLSVNVDLDTGQADLITRISIEDDIIIQAIQSAGFQAYKII